MLRLLAPLLVTLLVAGCGETPKPAPATTATPATKATPATAPSPALPLAPPVPGADDPRCGPAYVYLNAVRAEPPQGDAFSAVQGAYRNTALQTLVKQSDAATARQDDAAITAALSGSGPIAATTAQYAIHGALAQWMRQNLKLAAESTDRGERDAAWVAARCAWALHLRHLGAALVDRSAAVSTDLARDDATVVEVIDAAFSDGATAVTTDPVDERTLLPARQTVEKNWYRLVHRELTHHATLARSGPAPISAARALGLFEMLRDRMADKNTPGIAVVTAMLNGRPGFIDPAAVLREVDIALVKRARKYCSEAADPARLGTPAGLASVAEGAAYTRVLMPGLRALPEIDAAAHMASWQAFAEAVGAGEDTSELKHLSDELVQWNCAYQQALGIRECTATADEKGPAGALKSLTRWVAPAPPAPGSSPHG